MFTGTTGKIFWPSKNIILLPSPSPSPEICVVHDAAKKKAFALRQRNKKVKDHPNPLPSADTATIVDTLGPSRLLVVLFSV